MTDSLNWTSISTLARFYCWNGKKGMGERGVPGSRAPTVSDPPCISRPRLSWLASLPQFQIPLSFLIFKAKAIDRLEYIFCILYFCTIIVICFTGGNCYLGLINLLDLSIRIRRFISSFNVCTYYRWWTFFVPLGISWQPVVFLYLRITWYGRLFFIGIVQRQTDFEFD